MSLLNWSELILAPGGEPTIIDIPLSPGGVEVEIYKNWVSVRDRSAWREGTFVYPVVMQIVRGEVMYMDARIIAERGPQNGVYAAVWYAGEAAFAGCGVERYRDHDGAEIGISDEARGFLLGFAERYDFPIDSASAANPA